MTAKISLPPSNAFCPQPLFLYSTYKADGAPNFGLFCWATYCWDAAFKFVACIGEDKLTRDRIRETGVFSASVVTEALLPFADFCGGNSGRDTDKSLGMEIVQGAKLQVPIPAQSPWGFELRVDKTLRLDDNGGSEIYVCDIVNVLADAVVCPASSDKGRQLGFADENPASHPVITRGQKYYAVGREPLGEWFQWKNPQGGRL